MLGDLFSVDLFQLLIRDEENDVPGPHAEPRGHEAFVQRPKALVLHRLAETVDRAPVNIPCLDRHHRLQFPLIH